MNVTRAVPRETPVLRALANPAVTGSNTIVAAVAGRKIRVLSVTVLSSAINSIKFMSAATDITATYAFAANGGMVQDFNEHGWCETVAGEALNMNLTASAQVGVTIQYMLV
jgi:hypothetical protein